MRARTVLAAALVLACAAAARGVRAQDATPVPPAPPATAPAGSSAPFTGVVLEDPDERPWDLGQLAGHPVLLVVADRAASGASVEWGRGIGAARPQSVAPWITPGKVAVVSVADLRAVPAFARGTARWIIAQMVGEQGAGGPPLLLDWDGAVAARIGARDEVPNVRLYAADGTLVLQDQGDATPERVARLAAAVDGLVPPPSPAVTPADAEERGS
ncbi:MAG: hypothetical protein FJ148_20325 [Deltaproteobacteria bacterium]|nr:hypothetical protein [Deltaproteobacteria bacterium]